MKIRSNRILSFTLVLSMLLGLVPAYAWESFGNNIELQGEEAEEAADSPFCVS